MNPTTERELKLDIKIDCVEDVIGHVPGLCKEMNWDYQDRISMVNHDRYFDQLQSTGIFLLHSNKSYIRVRKSVWSEKNRQAEFIAYRKLTEAVYGKPAEIYDYEISVLKTQEITSELFKDFPKNLVRPMEESIGAVEHLESMNLSEIVRLKCHRFIWVVRLGSHDSDRIKIKIDRVTYKSPENEAFSQLEIDYYSPSLFEEAARFVSLLTKKIDGIVSISSMSKLDRGLSLL